MRSIPVTLVKIKLLRGHKTVVNKTGPMPSPQVPTESCHQCGGSGMLRLSDQRYRTCLECLGQGKISPLQGAITTAYVLHGQPQDLMTKTVAMKSAPKQVLEVNAVEFSSGAK